MFKISGARFSLFVAENVSAVVFLPISVFCFLLFFFFAVVFLLMLLLSVLFLATQISLPGFLCRLLVIVLMYRQYLESWQLLFAPLFLTHTVCLRYLLIISMVYFSISNLIPLSWLYILTVSIRVFQCFIFPILASGYSACRLASILYKRKTLILKSTTKIKSCWIFGFLLPTHPQKYRFFSRVIISWVLASTDMCMCVCIHIYVCVSVGVFVDKTLSHMISFFVRLL